VPLLDQVEPGAFLADNGYDSDALVEALEARDITPVIPPKANRREPRHTDFALYCERNLVERFFSKLKQARKVFASLS
jgi:transposase